METEIASDTGEQTGFDMDAMVERAGSQLGLPPLEPEPVTDEVEIVPEVSPAATTPAPVVAETRTVPKSWPKEMHEHWGKMDPNVQGYWETREKQMLEGLEQYKGAAQQAKEFQSVLQPFEPLLKQQGLNAPQAVQYLLNAHSKLTQGTTESRAAAYQELGRSLGLQAAPAAEVPATIDPTVHALQQQMQAIQQGLTARQQADYQAAQTRTSQEVEKFASDPAHPHFNEVADDIVLLLKTGLSLQESYDKAIWANPLTREQQLQARLTSETEKQKENARLAALPKAKATRNNVRSLDSRKAPTESLGSMEDTIKATLQEIRQRVH